MRTARRKEHELSPRDPIRRKGFSDLKVTQDDIDDLRTYGFSDEQILEAVMCVGLAKVANYIGFGLGTVPDFESRIDLEKSKAATV